MANEYDLTKFQRHQQRIGKFCCRLPARRTCPFAFCCPCLRGSSGSSLPILSRAGGPVGDHEGRISGESCSMSVPSRLRCSCFSGSAELTLLLVEAGANVLPSCLKGVATCHCVCVWDSQQDGTRWGYAWVQSLKDAILTVRKAAVDSGMSLSVRRGVFGLFSRSRGYITGGWTRASFCS